MTQEGRGVYRLFDDRGTLLYVGVSRTPERRIKSHMTKTWGKAIAAERTTVTWYDSIGESALAEITAIVREDPLHNVAGRRAGQAAAGGRPPVGPQVNIAIQPDILARVDEAARAARVSRSEWIRRAIVGALPPQDPDAG